MNYYMYIQKSITGYPVSLCQCNTYDLDNSLNVNANILFNNQRTWVSQLIKFCSVDTFNKLLQKQEVIKENEEYLQTPNMQKTPNIEIVGDTKLNTVKYNKEGLPKNIDNVKSILKIPDNEDLTCEYIVKDHIKSGKILGYIPIGMNRFICVKKKKKARPYLVAIVITLSLIAIALSILIIYVQKVQIVNHPLNFG